MHSIANFRDFGGYPASDGLRIKRGLLFRSGSLAEASPKDLQAIAELGIRTVCDLRTEYERRREPDRLPGWPPLKLLHLPVRVQKHDEAAFLRRMLPVLFIRRPLPDTAALTQTVYQEYTRDFRPQFAQVLRLATDPANLPLLIHCTAGKDRTGFACSLIQLSLGVPEEVVMGDYLRSNLYLDGFRSRMLERLRALRLFGVSLQGFLPLFDARPEYLGAALGRIRADYGGIDAYLSQGLGITELERRQLESLLLEEK